MKDSSKDRTTNKALRGNEASLLNAQRLARVGNWEWNIETGEVWRSDQECRNFDCEPGELEPSYDAFIVSVHPEDRARVHSLFQRCLKRQDTVEFEFRTVRREGRERVLFAKAEVVLNASGKPVRMMGITQDITEQKHFQEALQKARNKLKRRVKQRTEELLDANQRMQREIAERKRAQDELKKKGDELQTILDHVPAYIFYKDMRNVILRVNKKAADSLGLKPKDMAGKHTSLFYPEDEKKYYQDDLEVIRSGRSKLGIVEPLAVSDGHTRWLETNKIPIRARGKQATGVLVVASDITERKRAEAEKTDIRRRLKNIIDSMPSVLVGVDSEGRITELNRRGEQLSGILQREAQGRIFVEVFPKLGSQLEQLKKAIREHQAVKTERLIDERNGETRYVDVMIYPLVADRALGAVIRLDDVTERVRMEEIMVQTEKMLSVGGLAAGMAHEINNPLGAILQGCQNALRRASPQLEKNRAVAEDLGVSLDGVHRYLETRGVLRFLEAIQEAGARAAKIASDMLAFSRRSESRFVPADLGELLDTAVRLAESDYDLKKQYDFKQIKIVRDYQAKLGELCCDKTAVEQVILNLLRNAAQALADDPSAERLPRIILRARKETDYARIEVIDNGPGMDEVTRKRAFEPFFTTKEVGAGTGLGLSVSYFIITEQHQGKLTVESVLGQGTRFIIWLPLG